MKTLLCYAILISMLLLLGCSKDDSPTEPSRQFNGITERDEWGDTLSVDPEDWVIIGDFNPPTVSQSVTLPRSRDGKPTGEDVSFVTDDIEYSIGAFPNPFIPGTGRLLIDLVIPDLVNVLIYLEDESREQHIPMWDGPIQGLAIISWEGLDLDGINLPDGIYRLFFEAGIVSSFGDVEIVHSQASDPPSNADYVLFAQNNYFYAEYTDYEYEVATTFGSDGELGGLVYTLPKSTWDNLDYRERFAYLPVFMNYDLTSADQYQYHYLLAFKHFQFGAGWPDAGDVGIVDSTDARWQKENSYHSTYVDLYENGP